MELVDRVQVAAGRAVEKEREAGKRARKGEEEDMARAETTVRRFKRACEKLTRENYLCREKIQALEAKDRASGGEVRLLREDRDKAKDELARARVQIARYEERSKDVVGYTGEIAGLKKVRRRRSNTFVRNASFVSAANNNFARRKWRRRMRGAGTSRWRTRRSRPRSSPCWTSTR